MIEMLNERYALIVSERSHLSKEEVLKLMESDNWFTAEEALKMGLLDEIK